MTRLGGSKNTYINKDVHSPSRRGLDLGDASFDELLVLINALEDQRTCIDAEGAASYFVDQESEQIELLDLAQKKLLHSARAAMGWDPRSSRLLR